MEKLNTILEELKNTVDEKAAKKLGLDKCKRIIEKLYSFSSDCEECDRRFNEIEKQIIQLFEKRNVLEENDFKQQKQIISSIISHLQKQHKLIPSGYYMSLFISIGSSLGVVFGFLIFDNIALGLPIGIGIGAAIGASFDEDAKKKGLTL